MGALDFLFPKECLGCRRGGVYICKTCLAKVPAAKTTCANFLSLWAYKGVIKCVIISLKYKFAFEIAEELANFAAAELKTRFTLLPKKASLVPIPLHWRRENWRGFNQSSLLGEIIAREMGWRFVPDLLVRKKSTIPQVQLRGKSRHRNIKGVFAVNLKSNLLITRAQSLILFDDVWTTGSTMKEAARVLKEAGAKKIWGLTIAG